MAAEHVVVLDAGTSGARSVVVRPGTGVVASARGEWQYEPLAGVPLGQTFDPDAFWSTLCDLTKRALRSAKVRSKDVAAVAVTSQRLGIVVIDGDGRSLYAGPNIDARAVAEGMAIDARMAERVYASTGKLPSLILAPARLQWLRNHARESFERASAVLAMGDWLAYLLTGTLAAERSLAGDCGLLDIATCERDDALLDELEVPRSLLPPLVDSGEVVGGLTKAAAKQTGLEADTPVVIAGGDTQCGLAGMGVVEPGGIGIVAGWSCPVQQVTAQARFDEQRRTWTCRHTLPDRWLVESSASDVGRVWRWWCETLLGSGDGALDAGAALAAKASPAGDLLALLAPAPMNAGAVGLRQGGLLMSTPIGALGEVGRPELLRACLENIAYAVRANVEQAEEVSGLHASAVALGGGLTQVDLFPRILAAVLDRPVDVARDVEVTALGATTTARPTGFDAAALRAPLERLEPDRSSVDAYQGQYERWLRLGRRLEEAKGSL